VLPDEPLTDAAARKLARIIAQSGTVVFGQHAVDQMVLRGLTNADCLNVIRGGWSQGWDFRDQTYRYQLATHRIVVVVAFDDITTLVVITCWRIK